MILAQEDRDVLHEFLDRLKYAGENRPVIFVSAAGVASFDDPRGPWARAANRRAATKYFPQAQPAE